MLRVLVFLRLSRLLLVLLAPFDSLPALLLPLFGVQKNLLMATGQQVW